MGMFVWSVCYYVGWIECRRKVFGWFIFIIPSAENPAQHIKEQQQQNKTTKDSFLFLLHAGCSFFYSFFLFFIHCTFMHSVGVRTMIITKGSNAHTVNYFFKQKIKKKLPTPNSVLQLHHSRCSFVHRA